MMSPLLFVLFSAQTFPPMATAPLVVSQQACLPLPANVQKMPLPPGICQNQAAAKGSIVQIQLDGDPSNWVVASVTGPARQRGAAPPFYNSVGRVPGVNKVYVFEFEITGDQPVRIVMRESPRFLTPAGTFTFNINNK